MPKLLLIRAARLAFAVAVVAASTALAPSASAADSLIIRADATQTGGIDLYLIGRAGQRVAYAEAASGTERPLGAVALGALGAFVVRRAVTWRCDRTTRRFVATSSDGAAPERSEFSVRTPSCTSRVSVHAPGSAKRGSRVRVRLADRFKLGGLRTRICIARPGGRAHCRSLRLRARGNVTAFRATARGRWRVVVRTAYQRAARTVLIGVRRRGRPRRLPRILFTGDSMMQSLDNLVTDRLRGRARPVSDVHVGTGLSIPRFDFVANTRRQVRRLRATATVVFLGANDAFDLTGPDGAPVQCCGEPWIQAYARRARRVIRAAGGRVFWLTLPAPRSAIRAQAYAAVNAAIARAVASEPRSRVVDIVPTISPGFIYRPVIERRGRRIRVREDDGIHVSVAGASIVGSLLIRALEAGRTLKPRR